MDVHPHDPRWILDDELFEQLKNDKSGVDLIDLLSAWYVYSDTNHSGQFSDLFKVLSAIGLRGFVAGQDVQFGRLDESAQEIYDSIVENEGFGYR